MLDDTEVYRKEVENDNVFMGDAIRLGRSKN